MPKKKAQKKTARHGPKADYSKATGGGRSLANAIGEMPQAHAAKELGVTAAFFNHLVRGRKTPGLELAIRIKNRFGVAAEDWLSVAK